MRWSIRAIVRRNPIRQREIEQTREAKLSRIASFISEKNTYRAGRPKADPTVAEGDITTCIKMEPG